MSRSIGDTYRELSDIELKTLLRQPAETFEPDGYRVLKQVAAERNLDRQVEEEQARESMPVSDQMVKELSLHRERIACPFCGCKDGTLNVHVFFKVVFVYVWVFAKKQFIIGCRRCRTNQLKEHMRFYLLLLLLVPVQTIISFAYLLYLRHSLQRIAVDDSPTEYLLPFISANYWHIVEGKTLSDTEPESGLPVLLP